MTVRTKGHITLARGLLPLVTLSAALLVVSAAARADDEPERVRRFDAPRAPVSATYPVAFGQSPSSFYVQRSLGGDLGTPLALWRLRGPDDPPELVADLASPGTAFTGWASVPVPIGDSLLVGTTRGLFRIDDEGPPRLLHAELSSFTNLTRAIGSVRGIGLACVPAEDTGSELWRTDGTPDGTALVLDIEPGEGSSLPGPGITVGSVCFFPATTSAHGTELWRTDGTAQGTALAVDLAPGPASSNPLPLAAIDGRLYVCRQPGAASGALWITDGTPEGTRLLHLETATGTAAIQGVALGSRFLFTAYDGTGTALWITDGTNPGTERLASAPRPRFLGTAGGLAYFRTAADSRLVGQLWRTDGTAAGTQRVLDTEGRLADVGLSPGVVDGAPLGDGLVFHAETTATGSVLWRTDGTPAGTGPLFTSDDGVAVVGPSNLPNDYYPGLFRATGDGVWFSGRTGGSGGEPLRMDVWFSDGTPGGQREVGLSSGRVAGIREMETSAGVLFLAAEEQDTGVELWTSDGTADGTERLTELAVGAADSTVAELTDMGDALLFVGGAGAHARSEIRRATAEAASVAGVVDDAGTPGSAYGLTRIGDLAFFGARFGTDQTAWRTDGTLPGTFQVGDDLSAGFADLGGEALFFARDGGGLLDLWASDGTPLGTRLLRDLPYPGWDGATRAVHDGELFFPAGGQATGRELWRSDGTGNGTVLDEDVLVGSDGSSPSAFVTVGDKLYFSAIVGASVRLLFVRDADGTISRVWEPDDLEIESPTPMLALGGDLLFVASDADHGQELWRTDGTLAGTERLRDIAPGWPSSLPRDFLDVGGGRAVFTATDGRHGVELWTTDGTAEGTQLVADLMPGLASARPADVRLLGEGLLLAADGDGPRSDLWRIPLARLDALEEPAALPDLEPLPPLPPAGAEPTPPPFQEPPVEPPPPVPEALAIDRLRLRRDLRRAGRDSLLVVFRLPLEPDGVAAGLDGLPLAVDVGGVVVDVTLDRRGRAVSQESGARVRVAPIRRRPRSAAAPELRVTVRIRGAELAAALADLEFEVPDGERRVDRTLDIAVTWGDIDYAADPMVRYRARRRLGRGALAPGGGAGQ